MKRILLLTILFSTSIYAQSDFNENIIISEGSNSQYKVTQIHSADIDGDGDMDVLSAYETSGLLAWYENRDGLGKFGVRKNISSNADEAKSITTSDIDGDGDLDVLSASYGDDKIAWYENTDGLGNFSSENIININADGAISVFSIDIDGDGDNDVISASYLDNKIAWYENTDGLGTFGTEQIISSSVTKATSVYAIDIDGDNDIDILSSSSTDNRIYWHENTDSQGNFGTKQMVNSSWLFFPESVSAADIDGDGDNDVVSASSTYDRVVWYENNGLGSFGSGHIVSSNTIGANDVTVYTCDIDNDGDIDILSTSLNDNKIAWSENIDGLGTFSAEQIINNEFEGVSVCASDINGDGNIDVIYGALNYNNTLIMWNDNTNGLGDFTNKRYVNGLSRRVHSVIASDIDGDGDKDILSGSWNSCIAWYENADGLGAFDNQKKISLNQQGSVYSINSSDLDGDGDIDVVAGSSNAIYWYKNIDGLGNFGTETLITTDVDNLKYVYTSDLDGDGDLDVLSASYSDDKIAWYENTDGLGAFGAQQIISTTAYWTHSVYAVDLDGDGDKDVLSASKPWITFQTSKIVWYENTDGLGNFSAEKSIASSSSNFSTLFPSDVDGDGDFDVVISIANLDEIFWVENLDGLGNFGAKKVITTEADYIHSIYASDMDGDGDIDVVSASRNDNKIAWYENTDGLGTFGAQQVVSDTLMGAYTVFLEDFNGDGKIDIVAGSFTDSTVVLYENNIDSSLGIDDFNSTNFIVYPNPTHNKLIIDSSIEVDKVEVFSYLGILVNTNNSKTIDLSNYANGVYFVKITSSDGKSEVKKVVKK